MLAGNRTLVVVGYGRGGVFGVGRLVQIKGIIMATGISIDKCPHGVLAITVFNDERGIAIRLTPSSCCGKWYETKRWPLTKEQMVVVAKEIADFAGMMKDE